VKRTIKRLTLVSVAVTASALGLLGTSLASATQAASPVGHYKFAGISFPVPTPLACSLTFTKGAFTLSGCSSKGLNGSGTWKEVGTRITLTGTLGGTAVSGAITQIGRNLGSPSVPGTIVKKSSGKKFVYWHATGS
jgi:hypothetical protein